MKEEVNIFLSSLMGTTIQDGGTRERKGPNIEYFEIIIIFFYLIFISSIFFDFFFLFLVYLG